MEIKANLKHLRMSPRKVRLVVDVVRGLGVEKALDQLKFMNKKAAKPLIKLIDSGVANAENSFELEKSNLFIKEIRVDEGVTLKRWMPRAQGRATPIRKRASHISLVLGEIKESKKKKAKSQKIEAPIKLGEKPKQAEKPDKAEKTDKTEKISKEFIEEKSKEIVDPRGEGRGEHTKIEGGSRRGFMKKVFRRKSG
ncbi:50S ribosomal protein L22 [Candidatus Falkowbacteria bacterium CG11_big_fil_rev_8_21_14_0_20_39_10]|uniref:Large ribosomal subunit protein uL22 n=1 Tax=Candidatus Falkowbacteria bacterium CG11_big_fil_rev_8_21_14_0_20_39_10 TaxID=1974570 RepID=A0A2M6K948_9BACT|nr:MAG: 50S ribosomal protein L22 [Candidatus Falkowbacteria bacterium CG11_big_fil_rev_8_21_14_0_20_39_10]